MLRAEEDPAVEAWCAAVQAKHEREKADRMAAASAHGYWLGDDEPVGLPQSDAVNMPSHYTQLPVEAIDITEHFNFCMGNALKYIWRADHKGKPIEDLRKAIWYLQREVERRQS